MNLVDREITVVDDFLAKGMAGAELSPDAATASSPRLHPAILAICSDLDETVDAHTYFELMRFLNTQEDTSMGPGVGLEIGNTLYFDMPPGHFSYWNTTEENREKIRLLIRSGHIDCLHSFGDLASTRRHAARALEELTKHGCRFKVWIDHAQAVTNFGADIMKGHGDEPGHPAYHADLTIAHGIKHVWRGRVTSVIAQGRRFSLRGIARWNHPLASIRTLGKETAKQLLAHAGNSKFSLHRGNHLTKSARLRDGQNVTEFIRCNPCWAGVSSYDRGDGIHQVLTRPFLDTLAKRGGPCILYTHLGKLNRGASRRSFDAATIAAFRLLAEYSRRGRIRVTTTARLLEYCLSANVEDSAPPPPAMCPPLRFPSLG